MGIPLGPLREALSAARLAGPAVAKATKKTIRVLHNEGNIDSLTGMLKGKSDYNVKATMDDMMYPSSKTPAGYANDGYSAASMAKLPKGTVTNRAGSGAMMARTKTLARASELRVKDSMAMRSRVQGLARGQEIKMGQDLAKQATSGKSAHESAAFKAARGRAFAKRNAILKNKAKAAANAGSVIPKKTPTGLAAIPKGEVPGTGRGYTDVAGKGPKAPVLGKGGRNQVSPAGQAAYEKATGKSMFGPNGEGMPSRQRAAWARKNQGK